MAKQVYQQLSHLVRSSFRRRSHPSESARSVILLQSVRAAPGVVPGGPRPATCPMWETAFEAGALVVIESGRFRSQRLPLIRGHCFETSIAHLGSESF